MKLTEIITLKGGFKNTVLRGTTIFSNYGLTVAKSLANFQNMIKILKKYRHSATFAVPAVVVKKHPWFVEIARKYNQLELALHGYAHINHAVLQPEKQRKLLKKAVAAFKKAGIEPVGFRAPYLSRTERLNLTLKELHFKYDASVPFFWQTETSQNQAKSAKTAYAQIIKFYKPKNADLVECLPYFDDGLVCIPTILPDDEIAIDRLKLLPEHLSKNWCEILDRAYERGELAVFLFHLERFQNFKNAFVALQKKLIQKKPPVWVTNLKQIAEWWTVRKKFDITLKDKAGFQEVKVDCSPIATVLVRGVGVDAPAQHWYGRYKVVLAKKFKIFSPKLPAIGVSGKLPANVYDFLQAEGFCVEESESASKYSIYIDNLFWFDEKDKLQLLSNIEQSLRPIIRIWRWPFNARCCAAFSVDVDALCVYDFFTRILFKI